jgi:hypothetical protein
MEYDYLNQFHESITNMNYLNRFYESINSHYIRSTFTINKHDCFINQDYGRFPITKSKPIDIVMSEIIKLTDSDRYKYYKRNDPQIINFYTTDLLYIINYLNFLYIKDKHILYSNINNINILDKLNLRLVDFVIVPKILNDEEEKRLRNYKVNQLLIDKKYYNKSLNNMKYFHNGISMGISNSYKQFIEDCKTWNIDPI